MADNPITTARIGRYVYDIRHWKLTLFVFVVVWIPVFVCRAVSGRNLRGGGRSTDATFLRGASSHPRGWWNNLPGVARAGIRLAVVGGVMLWFRHPAAVGVVGALLLGVVVWRVVLLQRQRLYERRVLRPVWPAVAGIIGAPVDERPSKWLDIPSSHTVPDDPSPEGDVVVGLRTADIDDEKRMAALVQLFSQRFGRAYVGRIDYARRVGYVTPRPAEPLVWPAVAAVVGVPATVLAHDWLDIDEDNTTTPGAVVRVRLPDDVIDETDIVRDLRTVTRQRFGGDWNTVVKVAEWPYIDGRPPVRQVLLVRKAPPATPPAFVDFLAEHPDYQERN